jgi:uncharacterized protein with ParB-like and HNH nuclease domain
MFVKKTSQNYSVKCGTGIIPEFQRPYKWDIELCETLWNDIEDFSVIIRAVVSTGKYCD